MLYRQLVGSYDEYIIPSLKINTDWLKLFNDGALEIQSNPQFLVAEKQVCLIKTHSCLRVPLEIVVCIYDTFDNNFGSGKDIIKYLKESC